jgi:hypothetical protein
VTGNRISPAGSIPLLRRRRVRQAGSSDTRYGLAGGQSYTRPEFAVLPSGTSSWARSRGCWRGALRDRHGAGCGKRRVATSLEATHVLPRSQSRD